MSEKYYSEQEEAKSGKDSADRKGINIGLILFIIGLVLAIIGGLICHNTDLNKYYKTRNFEESFSASNVKNITFDNNVGDIVIKKSAGKDITVTATNVSEEFKAEVVGDTLTVSSPKTKNYWLSVPWFGKGEVKTVIDLPEKEYEKLTIDGGVGDIELSDLKMNDIYFEAGTGDIRLTNMTCGDTTIKNGTGDINIKNTSGGLFNINMGTGDLTANGFKCKKLLNIDSGVGDINITGAETGGLDIDTGTGDITFSGTVNFFFNISRLYVIIHEYEESSHAESRSGHDHRRGRIHLF